MASTLDLLARLNANDVQFVIVGGVAGLLHGSCLVTRDLDICAPLTRENLTRMLAALAGLDARFRMTLGKRPLSDDPIDYVGYKNLYLLTDYGQLDTLSEIAGIGGYENVALRTIMVSPGRTGCRALDLDGLMRITQNIVTENICKPA